MRSSPRYFKALPQEVVDELLTRDEMDSMDRTILKLRRKGRSVIETSMETCLCDRQVIRRSQAIRDLAEQIKEAKQSGRPVYFINVL